MARLWVAVGLALILAGTGCSGSAEKCGLDAAACPSGNVCIMGGTCAQRCDVDGAAPCPLGTSCQLKGAYCTVTSCTAIGVRVCQ
jgi:hypothetical protein